MKDKFLATAAALLLVLCGASGAQAFSVDHSTMTNADGTLRFSDPDDKYENAGPGGQPGFLPGGSPSVTFGVTQGAHPGLPFAPSCSGPGCAGQ